MRRMLVAAVALGPLVVASGAYAQTVVSNTRTTPIATATANSGSPADIEVTTSGRIEVQSGAAITVDSDNDVENEGVIEMDEADDGAIGILIEAGHNATVTNAGTIRITDDLDEAEDTDDDGDADGPMATGTDRWGIRLTGPGALTGDIINEARGSIAVEGNQSYGIGLESDLDGDLINRGTITVLGDDGYAIRAQGEITGDVTVSGSIAVRGENSVGVSLEGDVGGAVVIDGAILATGFRRNSPPSTQEALDNLDADDLLIGGAAVHIGGDVAGGVLLEAAQANNDPDDDDEDNDGIPDNQETTALITSAGSAPAVEIGSASRDVVLGTVGAGDEAYGFINRGEIGAFGTYEGISATGVLIGGGPGFTVTLDGGFANEGSIGVVAIEADATGARLGDGATADVFLNRGNLTAQMAGDEAFDAVGVDIAAGAAVTTLNNHGMLAAGVTGEQGDAYAVRDASGTLSVIENSGAIMASVEATPTEDDPNPVATGSAIALDLSANTSGITITQYGELTDPDLNLPDADGDGVADRDEPIISGEIRLGSGGDLLDIQNGRVLGDIDFGAGADALIISGGAEVRGVLQSTGGLDITVADGLLDTRQTQALEISNLTVGADGDLIFTIDPENNASGSFTVTGAASFADGAGLGVRLESLLDGPERFVVVDAATLDFGDVNVDALTSNSPYLYVVDAGADIPAGEVYIDVRRRTAQEADFIAVEEAAYDSIYTALGTDDAVRDAFLAQTGRDGFMNLYEQMLPDHSGGPLLSLASGLDAVTRALAGRSAVTPQGETSAWLQEINFYAEKDQEQAYGFESEGFGLAGGIERGTSFGAVGLSVAFTSSDLEDPEAEAEEQLSARLIELGLYWRLQRQNWSVWARGAAGYATFDATRQFVGGGLALRNESSWSGFTAAAAAGASYERQFGRYSIRPEVRAEYFMLSEEDRIETGGGDAFDLIIDERDGHIFSATAAVNFGAAFGQDQWFRPEFHLGWRQNISYDAGLTTARFASGGPAFILAADTIEGGGPVAGFRLNFGNAMGALSLEGDAEMIDEYVRYSLLLRATFRF